MTSGTEKLAAAQVELLDDWLPGFTVTHDHSWGLVGTVVLELVHHGERYIAKAGDDADHHLAREIHAHSLWLQPWTSTQRAPERVQANVAAKLLVCRYLEGDLVQGSEHEWQPETYRQAGALLHQLHEQTTALDPDFEARAQAKTLHWLEGPHRIEPELTALLRAEVRRWPTPPAELVPTHGDWQPRNWLVDRDVVKVIDFGRAELRPAYTDFARLAVQQFRQDPSLETAFLKGYGHDPREADAWHRNIVREAIGTAVWAFQVGDVNFEEQGHRMIADALSLR